MNEQAEEALADTLLGVPRYYRKISNGNMKEMKIYIAWITGFVTALLASAIIFFKMVTMWLDKNYVNSLNLSPDADSLGIPIFGALIMGVMVGVGIIVFYIGLLAVLLYSRSFSRKCTLKDAFLKRRAIGTNVMKVIITIFTFSWILLLYLPFLYEYVNIMYVVTDVISVLYGVISLIMTNIAMDGVSHRTKV